MNWDLILDRTIFLCLGIVIGLFLGYAARARQDARLALKRVEELGIEIHGHRGEGPDD